MLSSSSVSGITDMTGRQPAVVAKGVAQLETILDYLNHWAAATPEKCFSAFLDRHGNPRETYTYQSFEARTRFLAEYIHEETALQRGDRVALVYPPGLEMVAAFIACARMGAIPVPIPPVTSVAKGAAARLQVGDAGQPGHPRPDRLIARIRHVACDVATCDSEPLASVARHRSAAGSRARGHSRQPFPDPLLAIHVRLDRRA